MLCSGSAGATKRPSTHIRLLAGELPAMDEWRRNMPRRHNSDQENHREGHAESKLVSEVWKKKKKNSG